MERFAFYAASAAFCLFLTVALTSAMTSDCLCDGLPGSQCDYCDQVSTDGDATAQGFQGQYFRAWEEEHGEFHHQWVDLHGAFHAEDHTKQEHDEFHSQMEDAHDRFHGILAGSSSAGR